MNARTSTSTDSASTDARTPQQRELPTHPVVRLGASALGLTVASTGFKRREGAAHPRVALRASLAVWKARPDSAGAGWREGVDAGKVAR